MMMLKRLSTCSLANQRISVVLRGFCSAQNSSGGDDGKKQPKFNLGIPKDFKGSNTIDAEKQKLRPPERVHPFRRTYNILKKDIVSIPHHLGLRMADDRDAIFPEHVDILIIGGSTIGSSAAFWLKDKAREGLRIAVIEKDSTVSVCVSVYVTKTRQ